MKLAAICMLLFAGAISRAWAQPSPAPAPAPDADQGRLAAKFSREGRELADECTRLKGIGGCIFTLASGEPIHVAFGAIAPKNGTAFGAAFIDHFAITEDWRVHWSADAVAARQGAWRAGVYINFARNNTEDVIVTSGVSAPDTIGNTFDDAVPIYSTYIQSISLSTLPLYGIVPEASDLSVANWTMQQTIVGGSALVPVPRSGRLGLSLIASVNGRFLDVGGSAVRASDARHYLETALGLRSSPRAGRWVRPEYRIRFHHFFGDEGSFDRVRIDADHEFPIYRTQAAPTASHGNTPNDCRSDPADERCSSPSRNRYGTVAFRLMTIAERAANGTTPFYMQPTLGGSDINGEKRLPGLPDYRLRAPNVLHLQASFEHALVDIPLPGRFVVPLGAIVTAERGQVSQHWDPSLFDDFAKSYSAGLTIRAGGFPEGYIVYGWGAGGHHVSITFNTALLGGGTRPSLY